MPDEALSRDSLCLHESRSSSGPRVAARVKNSTGAAAVYEERVRGVLGDPQLAKAYFRKPDHVVWTFGRPKSEEPAARMVLQGRDGR